MPELLLSSYFGSGGAADDSTNTRPALAAAFAALAVQKGGTIVCPTGICRLAAKTEFIDFMPIVLKGHGDSALRLMPVADRIISLTAQLQTLLIDGVNFLGALGTFAYTSNASPIFLSGTQVNIFNSKFLGITSSNTSDHGVVTLNNCAAMILGSIFSGSSGQRACLLLNDWRNANIKSCEFLDYAQYAGALYSRTPDVPGPAWIRAQNPAAYNSATSTGGLVIEDCRFDEGQGFSIHVVGGQFVKVANCKTNIGSGDGYHFENVKHVLVENCFIGYTTSGSKRAVTIKDCQYARLDGLRLGQDVDYIEISGTTKEVDIIGGDLNVGHNVTHPTSIYNPAGALIRVNGIRQKGSLYQVGR